MKLAVGMRLVCIADAQRARWRVIDFGGAQVNLRRLDYRASMDGRGPMEWCDTDETRVIQRGNLDILFQPDSE